MPIAGEASLVASLTARPPEGGGIGSGLEPAWAIEWRADLLGEPPSDGSAVFENRASIYTLRSRAEGGEGPDAPAERKQRLVGAVAAFDLVDLEANRDLESDLLARVPPERRLISWHGRAATLAELRRRFETMAATPARWYKLIPHAEKPSDGIEALALLDALGRDDVI
ncbi:MAG: type I 3-dehydroquinate dehydratase, partial [Deltaproteobacteria bacterium]|nr:type I 3-dehydroquinate dehydratase [Deltaproteobacteria bacterium]